MRLCTWPARGTSTSPGRLWTPRAAALRPASGWWWRQWPGRGGPWPRKSPARCNFWICWLVCVFFFSLRALLNLGDFSPHPWSSEVFPVFRGLRASVCDFPSFAYCAPRALTAEVVICTAEDTRAKGDDQAKVHRIARISQSFRVLVVFRWPCFRCSLCSVWFARGGEPRAVGCES